MRHNYGKNFPVNPPVIESSNLIILVLIIVILFSVVVVFSIVIYQYLFNRSLLEIDEK